MRFGTSLDTGASAGTHPVSGHEERFPPTRLSAGFGLRKETIAGMRRNGRDAPKADDHSWGERVAALGLKEPFLVNAVEGASRLKAEDHD